MNVFDPLGKHVHETILKHRDVIKVPEEINSEFKRYMWNKHPNIASFSIGIDFFVNEKVKKDGTLDRVTYKPNVRSSYVTFDYVIKNKVSKEEYANTKQNIIHKICIMRLLGLLKLRFSRSCANIRFIYINGQLYVCPYKQHMAP